MSDDLNFEYESDPEEQALADAQDKLDIAFSPAAPISRYDLFSGRIDQIQRILEAIRTPGQHITIFGERGVGKTSLVSILTETIPRAGGRARYIVTKINCEENDNFQTVWRKIFTRMTFSFQKAGLGINAQPSVESTNVLSLLGGSQAEITPFTVATILGQLGVNPIVIFDEFDRIIDRTSTRQMADTIKALSDESIPATVVIVGVADDVNSLIDGHESIERALVQIHMPRMSQHELIDIINRGLRVVKMKMGVHTKEWIADMSKGLPHYTHSLAKFACESALNDSRFDVESEDISAAIRKSIKSLQETIGKSHYMATKSARTESIYAQVLLACALAEPDDRGFFPASAVRQPLKLITGRQYEIPSFARHLNDFTDQKRAAVLEKEGYERNYRFRFRNPLLQPYTIFHGIANGLISETNVRKLEGAKPKSKKINLD